MQGQWLGQWDGAWLGDGQPSSPGAMSATLHGSGSLSAQLEISTASQATGYSAEVELRRWYVKRGKKLHIFAKAQDADAFLEAEQAAQEAVAKAQKTSRLARKRVLKAFKLDALPTQTIQIDALESLVDRYQLPVSLPSLIAQQDWEQVVQIMLEVQQMQDEEDLEMLLLSL
jgi:hypothetical protein